MIISTNENIFHFFILSAATLPNHNILTISQYYLKDILRTKKEKKQEKAITFFAIQIQFGALCIVWLIQKKEIVDEYLNSE